MSPAVDWARRMLEKPLTEIELIESDAHDLDADIDIYNRDQKYVAEHLPRWDKLTEKQRVLVVEAANELEARYEILAARKQDVSERLTAYEARRKRT